MGLFVLAVRRALLQPLQTTLQPVPVALHLLQLLLQLQHQVHVRRRHLETRERGRGVSVLNYTLLGILMTETPICEHSERSESPLYLIYRELGQKDELRSD